MVFDLASCKVGGYWKATNQQHTVSVMAPCCFSATCSRYWDGRFSNSLFAAKATMALRTGCSFIAACFQTCDGVLGRLGRFDPVAARARFKSPPPSPSLGGGRFDIVAWIASFQDNDW